MDGVPSLSLRTLLCLATVVPLAGCVTLEEIARQSGADPVTWELPATDALACHAPAAANHAHAPGDSAWIGHLEQDLVAALGPPTFRLGKPQFVAGGDDYVIDVYAEPQAARAGCIDAYRRNPCGVITAYECR